MVVSNVGDVILVDPSIEIPHVPCGQDGSAHLPWVVRLNIIILAETLSVYPDVLILPTSVVIVGKIWSYVSKQLWSCLPVKALPVLKTKCNSYCQ
jgi:hypothetical protein